MCSRTPLLAHVCCVRIAWELRSGQRAVKHSSPKMQTNTNIHPLSVTTVLSSPSVAAEDKYTKNIERFHIVPHLLDRWPPELDSSAQSRTGRYLLSNSRLLSFSTVYFIFQYYLCPPDVSSNRGQLHSAPIVANNPETAAD